MWDKLSFRLKITVIFSLCLTILTIALTVLTIINSHQSITTPMRENMQHTPMLQIPGGSLLVDDEVLNFLDNNDIHDVDEIIYNHSGVLTFEQTGIYRFYELEPVLNISNQNFRHHSFIIAVIVIVVGTIGAYLVAGVIVKPIKQLANSMAEVEAEKLKMTLPVPKSHDEIANLTANFNSMLNNLHRSFESKQLFAQNASHELKTPLTVIRANLESLVIDDNPTNEEFIEVFSEVKTSTERMIGLVEGMLAMGKTPTDVQMTVIDMKDTFNEIFKSLQNDITAKSLTYQINGDLNIKGEEIQIRQAFLNLISNAVRYNKDGGQISVSLSSQQITIDDTGIGIPHESLVHIFDPFYCVDKSRSKKLGGNGLGLAITKNILETHQMHINITSEVGVGTSISIEL